MMYGSSQLHGVDSAGRTGELVARFDTRLSFGRYEVLPLARVLLRDGGAVCLGARAFDLLVLLLTERGKIVSKEAIIRHVWPTTTVDESNLRFQMAGLRRALGDERERIKTIPGRGYLFVPDDAIAAVSTEASVAVLPELDTIVLGGTPAILILGAGADNREALLRLLRLFADATFSDNATNELHPVSWTPR